MAIQTTQQARLQDDLRGIVSGDVRCDEIIAQLYATDAGLLESRPAGVVWPRSAADTASVVRYCAENEIPVHPRGSGTTTSGGAVGPGIILDFTRYMKRILHAEGETLVVQPGAIRERVNDILHRSTGRFFAPSSGFMPTDTLGSIISTDAAGPRWLKYGFPHDYVEELEVVTPDGSISALAETDLTQVPIWERNGGGLPPFLEGGSPFWEAVRLVRGSGKIIEREEPAGIPNSAGYLLRGLLDGDRFYPYRLFTGAEGSLGIITKIKVRTLTRSSSIGGAILLFDTLEKTAESVPIVLESNPSLCELIDRRAISMMCKRDSRFAQYLPSGTEYALLVELQDDSQRVLGERLNNLVHQVRYGKSIAFGSFLAQAPGEYAVFTEILKKSELALLGLGRGVALVSLFEDLQVPVPALPQFLGAVQALLRKRNVVYSVGGHLGQGHIRIVPIADLNNKSFFDGVLALADEICGEAVRFGGTVGSALGSGMLRTRFLHIRYPELFPVFANLKRAFDPKGIMNPQTALFLPEFEKYFTAPAGSVQLRKFETNEETFSRFGTQTEDVSSKARRFFDAAENGSKESNPSKVGEGKNAKKNSALTQLEFQFDWNRARIVPDVFGCTGCGLCRTRMPGLRMCPSFRHYPDEQASCRAKANVLRGILDGTLPLETLTEDSLKVIGNLCIGCHCCQPECPTESDIPKLSYRIRSAYAAAHGLTLSDKVISNLDIFLRAGVVCHCLFTLFQSAPPSRWLIEKVFGIARGRKFPKVERRRFLTQKHQTAARFARKPESRVVLFVDIFSDCYDTALPEAACAVLEHNGVEVVIPTRQKGSGHLSFAVGDMERAERLVRFNTQILVDYVRQGYRVITLEPISSVCISKEYLWQIDNPETRLVAEATTDISFFLYEQHKKGKLALDFDPVPGCAGYHAPCRTMALTGESVNVPTPAEELLKLIPRLNVRRLERGCCGLAGPSGFQRSNHLASLRLGMPLFLALRDQAIDFGATECNFCRLQMEQGSNKRVWHPVKLLAHAYGLKKIPSL